MSYDIVIKNGRLITVGHIFYADVAIKGERIAAIGTDLHGEQEIDATALYVIPGAIDGHVHLTDPTTPPPYRPKADSFAVGSRAAAFGGVTTLIDFVQPDPGQSLIEALDQRQEDADGQTVIDYALHMNLRDTDPTRLQEFPLVFARGIPTYKFFMTFEGYRLPDDILFRAMETVAAGNGLAIVHAENHLILQEFRHRLAAEGKSGPLWGPAGAPAIAEGEAIHRALALALLADVRILIYHVSSAEGVREISLAKGRGQSAFGEACVQYLVFTDEDKVMAGPPIRGAAHQAALWQGLAEGNLDIVSTDHNASNRERPNQVVGASSIETRLALVHQFGVRSGHFSLNRWVELCCTRPAQLFGLSNKGLLAPGYDADIVLFDPEKELTYSTDVLHSAIDYCTYEGITVKGIPVMTISRGQILVENGQFAGQPGHGRFVERSFD
jgi:dihydropyrimidinase